MAVQAGIDAATAVPRQFLGLDDAEERVGRDAAVFLGEAQLHNTGGRRLPVELARELLGLVPRVDVGHDLAVDEAAHGGTEGLVLLAVERARRDGLGQAKA